MVKVTKELGFLPFPAPIQAPSLLVLTSVTSCPLNSEEAIE